MMNCQSSCNSWIFYLFFPKCFLQNSEKVSALRAICNFFRAIFALEMDKFWRFVPFQRSKEDFYQCQQKITGKKMACFSLRRGKKLELLARIFTLVPDKRPPLLINFSKFFPPPTIWSPRLLGTVE